MVNEGAIVAPRFRLRLGTVEPEAGAAPELVLRALRAGAVGHPVAGAAGTAAACNAAQTIVKERKIEGGSSCRKMLSKG